MALRSPGDAGACSAAAWYWRSPHRPPSSGSRPWGGAIIARQGADPLNAGLFLSGFFSAGIFWALVLCTLAYQGGRLLGEKMVRFSYLASALIFAYFACYVIYQGYVEFVPGAP